MVLKPTQPSATLSLPVQQRRYPKYLVQSIMLTLMVTLLLYLFLTTLVRLSAFSPSLVPDAPGKISGRVTNDEGDQLAGIAVCVALLYSDHFCSPDDDEVPAAAYTDATGGYQVVGLGAGQYTILFYDPTNDHFAEYYDNVSLSRGGVPTPVLVAGNHVNGINASLTPAAKITGTLALAFGNVYIEQGQLTLFTAAVNGWDLVSSMGLGQTSRSYAFEGLGPGEYRLCIEAQLRWPDGINLAGRDQECYHQVTNGVENATSLVLTTGTTISNINFLLGETSAQVSGRVTDAAGKPLSGITVIGYLADEGYATDRLNRVETDGAGYYEFLSNLPGSHLLQFFDQRGRYGFAYHAPTLTLAQATPLSLTRSSNITQLNAILGPSAYITGHVHYSSSDVPQAGQVRLMQQTAGAWRTLLPFSFAVDPATGRYAIGGLAAGVYRLEASDDQPGDARDVTGYYGGATLDSGVEITLAAGETRGAADITLAQERYEGVLTGTVTAGGIGLSGMRVTLSRLINYEPGPPIVPVKLLELLTDANGHYRVAGLENGTYRVHFADPAGNYASVYAGNVQSEINARSYSITGTTVITHVDAALQLAGSLAGTVRAVDGTPISAIRVILDWFNPALGSWQAFPGCTAVSDAAGNYQMRGLLPGSYRIQFVGLPHYQNRYYDATDQFELAQTVMVNAGAVTTGLDISLARTPQVYLPIISQRAPAQPPATIYATLVANGNFNIFVKALERAELADLLHRPGSWAIFAPTDPAFVALLHTFNLTEAQLLALPELADLLRYHLLPSAMAAADLADGLLLTTVQGKSVQIEAEMAVVKVNGATILAADIATTNGVIHAIDSVMIPPPDATNNR